MTRTEIASLHVGSEVREYQTGIYADRKPVEKFGRPRRVVEVYHKGLSRKGRMYVNCFLAFGEDLRISATILEAIPPGSWPATKTRPQPRSLSSNATLADPSVAVS